MKSGRTGAVIRGSARIDSLEVHRLSETLAPVVFSGTLLAWSVWRMRPLRIPFNLRLRTLVGIVAIVPVEWSAGLAVWNSWQRWDCDRRLAEFNACWRAIEETPVRMGDVRCSMHRPKFAMEPAPTIHARQKDEPEVRRIVYRPGQRWE